uniref:Growth arrest-specific protein 7-like n=1 Tax=Mastacembelus armatus TaxID=205130 RepID=A0A7N8WQF1_9TELE
MSGSYCKSLYPFSGEQHQQGLSFEAGEIIKVVQVLPGGWWEGEKDGTRGWFPSSYVQVLEGMQHPPPLPMEDLRDPLPPHWRCYMSPQGRRYYVNTINNETTWERPSSVPGTPKTSIRHKNSLPINCVTFPLPAFMPEQQLLKPGEWSYCDYFWTDKKDSQGNGCITGFEVLLQKQLRGKQMQKEMAEFIRERIKIEEEYAKNLSKLSQIPLAGQEEGTLGEAWAQLKKSLADEAEVHLKFSSKLQSEVEKPLLTFRENFKKDMKRFDHHIADLRKQLVGRYAAVEKARKALADRQKELDLKTQQLEIKLSNKIEEDIKKARRKSTQAGDDLMRCVDLYNQSQSKWFEEMVTTSLELERLEVERVEMIRQHLCQYTTLRHETDMFNQSTMEPVDQLLQCVDPARDRELWVRENKTGEIRPVDIEI